MEEAKYTSSVPAVEQAARILLCLAKDPDSKMRLTDISRAVGIPKSKGYAILNTLMKFGFVQRDPASKTYSLGPGLMFLSRRYLDNLDPREVVDPLLAELAGKTKGTALFGLIGGEYLFVIAKQEGDSPFSVTLPLGRRFPLTAGAHGKALVAFMPEGKREEVMRRKRLYFHGDPARLDRERLQIEMAECRRRSFAKDLGEIQPGVNALAAPVFGPKERLIGAVILVGTFPEEEAERHGPLVAEVAKKASVAMGADIGKICSSEKETGGS